MGGTLKYAWVCAVALAAISAAHAATTQPSAAELLKPSVITLHYHNAPLMDMLEDFAKQAGAEMGIHRKPTVDYATTRRVTIDVDHASFWQALRAVSKVSDLHPLTYYYSRELVLEQYHWEQQGSMGHLVEGFDLFSANAREVGPFLVLPLQAGDVRHAGWTADDRDLCSMWLQVAIIPEPRLRFLGGVKPDWFVQCVDDRGNSFLPAAPVEGPYASLDEFWTYQRARPQNDPSEPWCWVMRVLLDEPANMGGKIARLKGDIKAELVTKSDSIEIDGLEKMTEVIDTVGSNVVRVKQVRSNESGGWWTMEIAVRHADKLTDEIRDQLGFIELRDAKGAALSPGQIHSQGQSEGELNLSIDYLADREPPNYTANPPTKLLWAAPKQIEEIAVPFELSDLPLPHRVVDDQVKPSARPAEAETRPTTLPACQPAVISMHCKDAPMQTVLDDFAKQAGANLGQAQKVVADFAKDKRVSIDLDHAGFWKAGAALCKATGLHLELGERGEWLLSALQPRFVDIPLDDPRGQILGPFQLVPLHCEQIRLVNYAGQFYIDGRLQPFPKSDSSTLRIALALLSEPKYRMDVVPDWEQMWLSCSDEKGHDLPRVPKLAPHTIYPDLIEPADMGRRIADLKVLATVRVYTRIETLDVPNITMAKNVVLHSGANRLMINKLTKSGANWVLDLTLTGPLAEADRNSVAEKMLLVTGTGRLIRRDGIMPSDKNGQMLLSYEGRVGDIPPDQLPQTFRWVVSADSQDMTVPFELHDLPLPGPK